MRIAVAVRRSTSASFLAGVLVQLVSRLLVLRFMTEWPVESPV